MGKLLAEARGELTLSADILDYYAQNAERFLAPQDIHPKTGATMPDLPFDGIKDAGYDRELSSMEIQEFVTEKPIRTASIDAAA